VECGSCEGLFGSGVAFSLQWVGVNLGEGSFPLLKGGGFGRRVKKTSVRGRVGGASALNGARADILASCRARRIRLIHQAGRAPPKKKSVSEGRKKSFRKTWPAVKSHWVQNRPLLKTYTPKGESKKEGGRIRGTPYP